jgi:hypothetical protein
MARAPPVTIATFPASLLIFPPGAEPFAHPDPAFAEQNRFFATQTGNAFDNPSWSA